MTNHVFIVSPSPKKYQVKFKRIAREWDLGSGSVDGCACHVSLSLSKRPLSVIRPTRGRPPWV
jgi:hypothetical protein